jgi:hypothetical protein
LKESAGEVLPQSETLALSRRLLRNLTSAASHVLPEEMPFMHRREHLAIIITEKSEVVSQQLLAYLKRGVTALEGTGMYSHEPRSVLLCAIAPAEIARLKSLVYSVDESAFVVVNPTEQIWGAGFGYLGPRWRRQPEARNKDKKEG